MKHELQQRLALFQGLVPDLSFQVRFWDGQQIAFGEGKPAFNLFFKTSRAVGRLLASGEFGFCEEYMAGNIDVDGDFRDLMRLGVQVEDQHAGFSGRSRVGFLFNYIRTLNFPGQARRNISHHYDLGNDFYRLWLDESMTYSCAYFPRGDETLEEAQQQKYEYICRKLALKEGEILLDIGCGWGGMLIHAAQNYGIKGVGCTLSRPQAALAQQRVRDAGLQGQVAIQYMDYRSLKGKFDKFVSIGMFEHAGRNFIPGYMKKAQSLLKTGGLGLLHTIGRERRSYVNLWTSKYIFPGGYVPSLDEVVRAMGRTGLVPIDIENLRPHYAMTLDKWSGRFESHVPEIRSKFDERFVRMWRLFLNGSAAGFRYGNLRLYHVAFTNGLNNTLPLSRASLYEKIQRNYVN